MSLSFNSCLFVFIRGEIKLILLIIFTICFVPALNLSAAGTKQTVDEKDMVASPVETKGSDYQQYLDFFEEV